MATETSKETRARIERWLRDEFDGVAEEQLDDMAWSYRFVTPAGHVLVLSRPMVAPEAITITASIGVGDEHSKAFTNLPRDTKSKFLWDLAIELLRMELHYEGLTDPMGRILVYSRVFYDGMTRDLFMRRVYKVDTAITLIIALVLRLIGEPFRFSTSKKEDVN